jgi:biopolymer transport protein ExbD
MAGPEKTEQNTFQGGQSDELLAPRKDVKVEEQPPVRSRRKRFAVHEYPLNLTAMMDMMTIILVYLLKSYSSDPNNIQTSDELKLPMSTTTFKTEEAVPVAITKKSILVNDKMVATVTNGKVTGQDKGGSEDSMLIAPLLAAMKSEAEKQKMIAKYNKNKEFKGMVLVIGDKMVPFRLLTEVLYTVGQAEFGQYKFAVTMESQ